MTHYIDISDDCRHSNVHNNRIQFRNKHKEKLIPSLRMRVSMICTTVCNKINNEFAKKKKHNENVKESSCLSICFNCLLFEVESSLIHWYTSKSFDNIIFIGNFHS